MGPNVRRRWPPLFVMSVASGHLDFDPTTGEALGNIEVWEIADGGFRTVKIVSP